MSTTVERRSEARPRRDRIPPKLRSRAGSARSKLTLVGVIILIVIVTASQSSVFFTTQNLINILSQTSVVGILACGTTFLMVSGGLDLSIGSNVSFSGMLLAYMMIHGVGVGIAIVLCMVVAAVVGAFNGTLAAFSKSHPFVVTLGMLTALQGAALLISDTPLTGLSNGFVAWTGETVLGLPLIVWVFLATSVLVQLTLSRTKFGRHLYALGGSEAAAKLAGIRIGRTKVLNYTIMGLLVGVAAVALVSQVASADATMGQNLELSAIAAVAVGGTPLAGGRGDIFGTFLGVFLLGLIGNALNLMSISPNFQYVLQGLVIVVAVMAQRGDS